jgi:phosphatidylserine decarboxylase
MKKCFYPLFSWFEQRIQKASTYVAGWLARSETKRLKNYLINYFIQNFDVDMQEAVETDPFAYKSFNAFFTRALRPDARQIESLPRGIVSPVDGRLSAFGIIQENKLIQAKHIDYKLSTLLDSETIAAQYRGGKFITVYLAPTDYHRIHMPVTAQLMNMRYVPGRLYPVKPQTVESVPDVFALNERLICHFQSQYGNFVMVLIGAQLVSGIETVWHGPVSAKKPTSWDYSQQSIILEQGREMGRFNFGSTIILCLPSNSEFTTYVKPQKTVTLGKGLAQFTSETP